MQTVTRRSRRDKHLSTRGTQMTSRTPAQVTQTMTRSIMAGNTPTRQKNPLFFSPSLGYGYQGGNFRGSDLRLLFSQEKIFLLAEAIHHRKISSEESYALKVERQVVT